MRARGYPAVHVRVDQDPWPAPRRRFYFWPLLLSLVASVVLTVLLNVILRLAL